MIGNLSRIPEDVRVALHESPEAIQVLLYPELASEQPKKPELLSRLFGGKTKSPEPRPAPNYHLPESDSTDIDKTWHALHFLFTESDWEGGFPEGFMVSCGDPIGDVDVGYGPARSFNPDEVKEIARYLSEIDRNALRDRFDVKKMHEMDIYPSIWKNCENVDDEWRYVEGGLHEVVRFVRETADKDLALLVYIN